MKTKNNPQKSEKRCPDENPAVRNDVVDFFKKKIASRDYCIRSNEIAEKMVQKLREQPAKTGPYNIGKVL